jgi:WhiB family redox-sensing transcriptional regulator
MTGEVINTGSEYTEAEIRSRSDALRRRQAAVEAGTRGVGEGVSLSFDLGTGKDESGILPWQEEALCAQTEPEAFFPEKGGSTREAKRVCGRCDVRGECLEYALAHDERFGIWGGLSERERRRLKRRAG